MERRDDVDAVQVCVRIRPLSSKEKQEQTKSCIRIVSSVDGLALPSASAAAPATSGPQQIVVGKDRAFTFDNVLSDTYEQCVAPLVHGFVEGYNATVLAYGQTGTGKTHTMSGVGFDAKGDKREDAQGIIPRVIKAIFQHMETNAQQTEFSLRVEYIEIYNEELRDLLHPDTPTKQLHIREDGEGNIVVAGVKSEVALTRDAVFRYLVLGAAARATGSTLMNEQSSRSHAIFSLLLHQRPRSTTTSSSSRPCRMAKFHLVDLAGSERAKRTGAVAGRFKESVSINQGLLALGNVVSALSDEKRRTATATTTTTGHVPYRDSKLTRLLADSLGGNAKTLMIACVSPATINFEETLNTLKYASRAKHIRNRPIVNAQDERIATAAAADSEIARMKQHIASLETQLQQTNAATAVSRPSSTASSTRPRTQTASTTSSTSSSAAVALVESSARIVTLEQQLSASAARLERAVETVESMRSLSLEAITTLIAMERELKPLGRPVQQQLNEAVKRLNTAIQTAQSCDVRVCKDVERPEHDDDDDTSDVHTGDAASPIDSSSDTRLKRLVSELKDAKHDLVRDEQIFEMKNAELQRLQTLLLDAKSKNEKLIAKVQQLERGGQLWSNVDTADSSSASASSRSRSTSASTATATADDATRTAESKLLQDDSSDDSERAATARTASATASSSSSGLRSAKAPSSRGLFTKRGGTAAYDGEEDNVLIGNGDDDDQRSAVTNTARTRDALKSRSGCGTSTKIPAAGDSSRISSSSSGRSDAVAKLERTIASLRSKVEELQQQNSELQHSRDESSRRWQLDRVTYERQVNDAEQTIESLRKEKQALEDTLIDEKSHALRPTTATAPSSVRRSQRTLPLVLELDEPEANEADTVDAASDAMLSRKSSVQRSTASRPSTATTATSSSTQSLTVKPLAAVLDECVTQLLEYNDARRQVLGILREKKDAEQSKDEAAKRLSALEMQKLRSSLSLRESISDVATSIQRLNDKMQLESRSRDELARLRKLKDRAERKLRSLRAKDERSEFLDSDAQHELADLVELIEDLDSHIAFQDAELAVARDDLQLIKTRSRADDTSPVDSLASALVQQLVYARRSNDDGAVTDFAKRVLEEIARLRGREYELLGQVSELQSGLDERAVALQQLETGLVAARKEFDRRLVLERQESAMVARQLEQQVVQLTGELQVATAATVSATPPTPQCIAIDSATRDDEWKKLIVSSQKKDEYIADLEKHVVFYKAKAKQMQAQLQQLIKESAKCNQQSDDDDDDESSDEEDGGGQEDGGATAAKRSQRDDAKRLQQRIQQLEDANDALMKDLATAKVYLRSASKARASGEGAQVVRISRSELRELPSGPAHAPASREGKRDG